LHWILTFRSRGHVLYDTTVDWLDVRAYRGLVKVRI
jgi:hypothetical protein